MNSNEWGIGLKSPLKFNEQKNAVQQYAYNPYIG